MNIFSNIGITELIVILLLALLVVGPERLPEMSRNLARVLRDLRKAYENLTSDLGPELASLQASTKEIRESVESVRTIPQDVVQSMVKAADLDDTVKEVKAAKEDLQRVETTVASARKVLKSPVSAATELAKKSLTPSSENAEDASVAAGEDTIQQETVAPEETADE